MLFIVIFSVLVGSVSFALYWHFRHRLGWQIVGNSFLAPVVLCGMAILGTFASLAFEERSEALSRMQENPELTYMAPKSSIPQKESATLTESLAPVLTKRAEVIEESIADRPECTHFLRTAKTYSSGLETPTSEMLEVLWLDIKKANCLKTENPAPSQE